MATEHAALMPGAVADDASATARAEPPAAGPTAAADTGALLRDRAAAMFSYNPTSLAGHALGAVVVELVFAGAAPVELRLGWGTAFALLWLARVALAWRIARQPAADAATLHSRLRWWIVSMLAMAALWGAAGWSFYPHGSALQQIALILVAYTFCVACVPILAPQFGLYLTFVALVYLPVIARVGLNNGSLGIQTAIVMAVAMAMTIVLGRNYRNAFDRVSLLQRRTEALMVQLRAEKADADDARREAEVANRAKTQFFAAASHDLRQPLHAMSLFAEALRQRSHDAEVIQLVNSINASVDALEGLFSELLDITRIDTGGVEVRPAHFHVGAIFRKLRLHFEPTAFEKGLALRFRGERHHGFADPLLVERILRNLVSNAIRYTEDGSVLVACRRRADRLHLQVWDTGPGIAAADRERIFEEFCQLPGDAARAPDQKKGLGLGLAIVRRLAGLMGEPLTLQSTVGRGSVFTLEVPVGAAMPAPAPNVPAKAPAGLTLAGRLIVIIEDEPAVRAGLEVLLEGWGAAVAGFDTIAAAMQWAAARDPRAAGPDLLIVDYRLEGGHTGTEAIATLRQVFGRALPAIMVTGSTMTSHDAEAERNDFHLLIKPVAPNKLRAMIGFKLGLRKP
ncbi:MAG TPA: ATP-binding protein [Burkholderiaceae bacterium]|nr:ATP-binding protein [Burkholderiaceae bacterium]